MKKPSVSTRLAHGVKRIVSYKKHHFSSEALGALVDIAEQFVQRTTETASTILQHGRITISSKSLAAAIKVNVASREFAHKLDVAGEAGMKDVNVQQEGKAKVSKAAYKGMSKADKAARKIKYGYTISPARVRHIMNEARASGSRLTFSAVVYMAFAVSELVEYVADVAASYTKSRHMNKSKNPDGKVHRVKIDDLAYIAANDALVGGAIPVGAIPAFGSINKLQRGPVHRTKRAKPDTACAEPAKKKARKAPKKKPACPKAAAKKPACPKKAKAAKKPKKAAAKKSKKAAPCPKEASPIAELASM
jgi:histone H3/H4